MKKSKYKVAKYMRLSRDDGDDRESESIENQIELCKNQLINKYNIKEENIAMVEYVERKWYQKFFAKILNIFRRK